MELMSDGDDLKLHSLAAQLETVYKHNIENGHKLIGMA